MVGQPAYLRNLKHWGRKRWEDDGEAIESAKSLLDESDRGAIIMAGSTVENNLHDRILQQMPVLRDDGDARKQMFGLDGALSTFSRKIRIAYALGLIDRNYRNKIDLIREVRNACAHTTNAVSFSSPPLRAACEHVIGRHLDDLDNREPETIRNAFLIEISFVNHYILTGERIEGADARIRHWKQLSREP